MDVSLDRSSLQVMKKDNTIREYAQRWREAATKVNPLLLKKEIINLFSNTFKNLYFEYLVGSSAQHFSDLIVIAERIKQVIWLGKIADSTEEKGFARKKEVNWGLQYRRWL